MALRSPLFGWPLGPWFWGALILILLFFYSPLLLGGTASSAHNGIYALEHQNARFFVPASAWWASRVLQLVAAFGGVVVFSVAIYLYRVSRSDPSRYRSLGGSRSALAMVLATVFVVLFVGVIILGSVMHLAPQNQGGFTPRYPALLEAATDSPAQQINEIRHFLEHYQDNPDRHLCVAAVGRGFSVRCQIGLNDRYLLELHQGIAYSDGFRVASPKGAARVFVQEFYSTGPLTSELRLLHTFSFNEWQELIAEQQATHSVLGIRSDMPPEPGYAAFWNDVRIGLPVCSP